MGRPGARKERKGRARHSSRDGAAPVVHRMTSIRRAEPPTKPRTIAAPPLAKEPSLSALLGAVTDLGGKERVPLVRAQSTGEISRAAHRAGTSFEFMLERNGERIQGHRVDLAPLRLAPGQGRTWVPETRLDLHGVRMRELDALLSRALRDCVLRAAARLLVIHGKGLHSARGTSVLADAVVEHLASDRHARYVHAFATAPERLGGTGALAVELDLRRGENRHR